MALANGQTLADEVYFRINGRLTKQQIVPYVNRGLNLIAASGSFVWDQASDTASIIGIYSPGNPLDPGKKVSVWNSPSMTPLRKVSQDEYEDSVVGYVDQLSGGLEYNSFCISCQTAVMGGAAQILCFPSNAPGSIRIWYHMLPPVLTYSSSPTVRWTTPWMDDLVCDYAESEISRILNLSGWQELEGRFRAKLIEAKKIYSTERETTGPPEEVQAAVQERDQVGRG